MKILCKLFGHRIKHGTINTHRMNATCAWCEKKLKVSYDMSYGETIVVGDYGDQRTFCYCNCGNELISTNSFIFDQYKFLVKGFPEEMTKTDLEEAECSKCGVHTLWDFGAPAPILIKSN